MKPLIMSVSGMRGVFGEALTPAAVLRYASAFGKILGDGRVVLGRDPRPSGEEIRRSILSVLLSRGCEVIDLGMCPTPTVHVNVKELQASGGLIITASHNPREWNGLKAVNSEGVFFSVRQSDRLEMLFRRSRLRKAPPPRGRTAEEDPEGVRRHIEAVKAMEWLNVGSLRGRRFKVALDCCNGAASFALPSLLNELGCDVVPLFCTPGEDFPRGPEPVRENLTQLSRLVKAERADVGFGIDPDGDRLSIVSEDGSPLGEEYTLALAARFALSKKRGNVVTNLSTSRMIDDIAEEAGVEVARTRVGEAWVVERMREVNALIGGEGNGGVILPEVNYTRDSLVAAALVLEHLLESGSSISELADSIPRYHMRKTTIPCDADGAYRIVSDLKARFANEEVDLSDGIRIDWPDSWTHLRKSNTEPIVRVIAESRSKEALDRLLESVMEFAQVALKQHA